MTKKYTIDKLRNDKELCREYISEIKWGLKPFGCNRCIYLSAHRIGKDCSRTCTICKKKESATAETSFESCKIDLTKVVELIYIITKNENSDVLFDRELISYLSLKIGITQKSCYNYINKIRRIRFPIYSDRTKRHYYVESINVSNENNFIIYIACNNQNNYVIARAYHDSSVKYLKSFLSTYVPHTKITLYNFPQRHESSHDIIKRVTYIDSTDKNRCTSKHLKGITNWIKYTHKSDINIVRRYVIEYCGISNNKFEFWDVMNNLIIHKL